MSAPLSVVKSRTAKRRDPIDADIEILQDFVDAIAVPANGGNHPVPDPAANEREDTGDPPQAEESAARNGEAATRPSPTASPGRAPSAPPRSRSASRSKPWHARGRPFPITGKPVGSTLTIRQWVRHMVNDYHLPFTMLSRNPSKQRRYRKMLEA